MYNSNHVSVLLCCPFRVQASVLWRLYKIKLEMNSMQKIFIEKYGSLLNKIRQFQTWSKGTTYMNYSKDQCSFRKCSLWSNSTMSMNSMIKYHMKNETFLSTMRANIISNQIESFLITKNIHGGISNDQGSARDYSIFTSLRMKRLLLIR